jgi:hypothetical protein
MNSLAGTFLVLTILSGLATLGVLFVGLFNMSRNVDGNVERSRRSNRLMWWRVRLQFLTIILMLLWGVTSGRI